MTLKSSVDVAFCRSLLREAHRLVKHHFPLINLREEAWVYHSGRDDWEFHGPKGPGGVDDQFYWYGSASNAYEARYKGWMAWLRHVGVES